MRGIPAKFLCQTDEAMDLPGDVICTPVRRAQSRQARLPALGMQLAADTHHNGNIPISEHSELACPILPFLSASRFRHHEPQR